MHKSLIWDIYTRLFHWLLVICFGLQWLTGELGEGWLSWHSYIGYFTLGLVFFRISWGVFGPEYARFSHFWPSVASLVNYLKGDKQQYLSHNPLGALMVFAMLLVILAQSISGLFTTDDIFFDGPLRSMLSGDWQEWADTIHKQAFSVLQMLVLVHVVAAFYYLLGRKQNLIGAMITGRKTTTNDHSIGKQHHLRALIVVIAAAALIYIIVMVLPPDVVDDFYY